MDSLDKIEDAMRKAHEYYKAISLDARNRGIMESSFVDGYIYALNEKELNQD